MSNCHNIGMIELKGTSIPSYFSGIIGRTGSTTQVENCYNTGNIVASTSNYVGGIVGGNEGGTGLTITHCYNKADISGKERVGGIVGNATSATINYTYNTGKIDGTSAVAGISGNYANISNSYNVGDITAGQYVAGISGDANYEITIENVYNIGSVSKTKANQDYYTYVGGIVGSGYSATLINTYNLGNVSAENDTNIYVGSIGYTNSDLSTSYYLKGTASVGNSYTNTSGGEADEIETQDEIKALLNSQIATKEGWTEDGKEENRGYPILVF